MPQRVTLMDSDGNVIIQGCTPPTGTANVQTNCGYQFGDNLKTVPKWYLDEANLNSSTTYIKWNYRDFIPGFGPLPIAQWTETLGWQVIFRLFGISDSGTLGPNYFQKTPCVGALQKVTQSMVNQMSATCSGL